MMLRSTGTAIALSLLAAAASSQTISFPFTATGLDAATGARVFAPNGAAIDEVSGLDHVTLVGAPIPGGAVNLELTRLSVARRKFGFEVDGRPAGDLTRGLGLSVWKGHIVGQPDSIVMLSFSQWGSRGWIETADDVVHFMPRPDESGDWSNSELLVLTESELNNQGHFIPGDCQTVAPEPEAYTHDPNEPQPPIGGDGGSFLGNCSQYEAKIALETDWQLYQVFGNLNAMTSYVTSLLTFVSDRYETQVSTVLTFPYTQFYTNSSDPWTSQDSGGSCIDVLNELQGAWAGNVPGNADLGHLLSGASLGCGVAWLDVLCNNTYNFSVSGNINGNVNFPVVQQPNNWDFIVVAHELGHNFASPHTHDYCPPLDECPSSQYWGSCQNQQVCSSSGTIMSYCHLCSGGTGNITTFFHPTAAGVMSSAVQGCLPFFGGSMTGDTPAVLEPNVATPVMASIVGVPQGNVNLHYRANGGSYTTIAMSNQGGGTYSASLPGFACDDTPEYYYSFTEASCGSVTAPDGAPANNYSATVADENVTMSDNFQTDMGWGATNNGASSGDWQRGVPVNDAGWDYDPASDYDGSGSCYLTQNQAGNTDVDGGSVVLTSPVLDLSGEISISYAYYLRLTNSDGTDMLLVEASSNGTSGPWTEIARHDTDGGDSWRTHTVTSADISIALDQTSAVRFTANDGDPQSINEAGLDAFQVTQLTCGSDQDIYTYCDCTVGVCGNQNPNAGCFNSSFSGGAMSFSGSNSVSADDFGVSCTGLPSNQNAIFYMGNNQLSQPFGDGLRCVGANIQRFPIQTTGSGTMSLSNVVGYSLANFPLSGQIAAGDTWNLQTWYRDPFGPCSSGFNLSNAVSATFAP